MSTVENVRLPDFRENIINLWHGHWIIYCHVIQLLKRCSHCARHCTMSYVAATTPTLKLTLVQFLRQCQHRTTSSGVVRQGSQRCRTMSCAVWTPLYNWHITWCRLNSSSLPQQLVMHMLHLTALSIPAAPVLRSLSQLVPTNCMVVCMAYCKLVLLMWVLCHALVADVYM